MFVKINKSKQHEYLYIVGSYRDENGFPRHITIANLGNVEYLKKDLSFHKVIERIQEIIGKQG
mgnify:CR=1 FL=1